MLRKGLRLLLARKWSRLSFLVRPAKSDVGQFVVAKRWIGEDLCDLWLILCTNKMGGKMGFLCLCQGWMENRSVE